MPYEFKTPENSASTMVPDDGIPLACDTSAPTLNYENGEFTMANYPLLDAVRLPRCYFSKMDKLLDDNTPTF